MRSGDRNQAHLGALEPGRGVTQTARQRMRLPSARTSEDSFCASARVVAAVVLARDSPPEQVRPTAPKTPMMLPSAVPHTVRPHWRPPALVAAPYSQGQNVREGNHRHSDRTL